MAELDFVQERLRVAHSYAYPPDDPLRAVKAAYIQLRKAAEQSRQHELPFIFWG